MAAFYNLGMAEVKSGDTKAGCPDIIKAADNGSFSAAEAIRRYCQ